ncbi:MAG: TAXI family TRAP transporter solute-binding subunit [Alphaproteobacteria bacterium]
MSRLTRRAALVVGAGAGVSLAAPSLAQSRTRLTIATGGTGGVFFPYGGGLARILTEKMTNTQATAQVTGGSVDNVKLVNGGDADIGFSTLDSAYDAMKGEAAYKNDGVQDVRVLALLYDSYFHVIGSQGAGVNSIADFKGKRVSVGSAGSSTESIADRALAAAGLNPQRDVTRDNLGVAESANALADGKIAGFFWIGGVPTAAVRDLAQGGRTPLKFVDTSKELAAMERQWQGLYRSFELPANSYNGQTAAIPGLGIANVLIVSGKAPARLVTTVLETVFANLADVHSIHPEARRLTLAGAAAKTAVPFHPAAEAFFKSKGVGG